MTSQKDSIAGVVSDIRFDAEVEAAKAVLDHLATGTDEDFPTVDDVEVLAVNAAMAMLKSVGGIEQANRKTLAALRDLALIRFAVTLAP